MVEEGTVSDVYLAGPEVMGTIGLKVDGNLGPENIFINVANFHQIWSKYFLIGPTPASFYLFLAFQTHITIFTTNKCEKCHSSI